MKSLQAQHLTARRAPAVVLAFFLAAPSVHVSAQTQASIAWVKAASENQSFAVKTPSEVRYGAGTKWVQRTLAGSISCTNSFFGGDPVPGVIKACEVGNPSGSSAVLASTPTNWVKAVSESQTFRVFEPTDIRYGVGTNWVQRTVNGSVSCTNSFFGRDPAKGLVKSCEIPSKSGETSASTLAPVVWGKAVDENQTFSVTGPTEVRYGVGATWIQRTIVGAFNCTNSFFGRDPAYGLLKTCQIAGKVVTGSAPPATVPPQIPVPIPAPAPSELGARQCVKR